MTFSTSEVYILGKHYPEKNDAFLSDVFAKSFFSYRFDFPAIKSQEGESVTSDAGWGCMHRSGQMLLAQALTYSSLGRGKLLSITKLFLAHLCVDFKMYTDQPFSTSHERETYLKVYSMFILILELSNIY